MDKDKNLVVAIIPARGGSKGVPRKNLQLVGGVPLIGRTIQSCLASEAIDQIWVSTDDAEIASVAEAFGAGVLMRPAELATDEASSESALIHAVNELNLIGVNPAVVAFLQTTSAFIDSSALAKAVRRVLNKECDSIFSGFETFAFVWRESDDGAVGVNHDHSFRPRRQDREPHFQETGAFYVFETKGFMQSEFRFFGKVEVEKVSESFAVDVDSPQELLMAQRLARYFDQIVIPPNSIDALVMDFDGVHTDDLAAVDANGLESVTVSRSDGMGIELLRKAGIPMLILSKERSGVVQARAEKLGIEAINAVDDKLPVLRKWCSEKGLDLQRVAYVGNDINDSECLGAVGWPIAPADAHPDVTAIARVVLGSPGGRGALRELASLILK